MVASGAALFALQASSSPSRSLPIAQSLRSDLTGLDGTLLVDDVARQAAAVDFGRIVRRLPIAVLKAGSVQDIVKASRYASLHDIKIAMRGQGHSMLGQAQADAGVVIDSSGLNAIRIATYRGRPAVEAGPGALWGPVLDAANASKLTPPVNVDPTYLSVGGTISTGGFGGTTWRDGFQVDHVLELQVVTGDGELVTCSDERNSDLFNAVLAGMGQCGIIVHVVMALVPAPTDVLFFVLNYDDLQTAVSDLTTLVNDGRFNHLDVRTTARPGGGFTINVEAGAFYDAPSPPGEAPLLAGLRFGSRTVTTMRYAQYYRRQSVCTPCTPLPHPWFYICLPASRFVEYGARVLATPAESAFAPPRFSVWRRSSSKRPLVRLPDEGLVVRFQISRNLPASADVQSVIAMNRTLYERAHAMGGTRLTTTAIPFSQADWIRHYGPVWASFRRAKERFDPYNVLTPGQEMFPA